MPEYDAFGREIGEDTLQQWRQGSGALPADPVPEQQRRPEPAPVSVTAGDPLGGPAPATAPGPATPPKEPPAQGDRQRVVFAPGTRPRKRRRGMARLIVLLFFGWILFNVISGLAGKVDEVTRSIPDLTPRQVQPPPTGLEPGSLLRPAAFERAMAEIRLRGGGKLQHLRVAPDRIDATLITDRTTLVSVQVSATEGYRRLSESSPGFPETNTLPYAKLDARAPQRLTRAAAERLGSPVGSIDYVVPSLDDGKVVWGAYFKSGAIFLANARGKITRRTS